MIISNYPKKVEWIQSTIYLQNNYYSSLFMNKDSNYRSRSILYLSISNYLSNTIPHLKKIIIPENGTISLNYPLTPSRSGSLSTRTTHPFYLFKMNDILSKLDIKTSIFNPYSKKTKGEVINECLNKSKLKNIFHESVSCGKRGRRQYWETKTGTNHCGICVPCIYRRAGLHKVGWDTQKYGNDLLTSETPEKYKDFPALLDYLQTTLSKDFIKRNLIVNGSIPLNELDDYAELIIRSRRELIKWIKDRGNHKIKSILGVE